MANYQWTGSSGTGVFAVAANWNLGSTVASVPPGPNDFATIASAAEAITGGGTVETLFFQGTDRVAGQLTATYGSPVNGEVTLLPGAVLTAPMLHIGVQLPQGAQAPFVGTLTVGKDSRVVIAGTHTIDNYGIMLAAVAPTGKAPGSNATLVVDGENAVVDGGNLPMSVGQVDKGQLIVRNSGTVSVGNDDPLIYPWPLVIGNHPGANGEVQVSTNGLLQARGQVIVGREANGTLEVSEGGTVVAKDLAIGWAPATGTQPAGVGTVTVTGGNARLVVENQLEVQHMGTGSLTVENNGFVSAGISILVNGTLTLSGGQIETNALAVNPPATLSGSGTVTAAAGFYIAGTVTAANALNLIGDIDNASTITVAENGHLRCLGTIVDTGKIALQLNGIASVEAVPSSQTIEFLGNGARLVLLNPGAFLGNISGFAASHKIELDTIANKLVYTAPPLLTVEDAHGNVVAQLTFDTTYPGGFKFDAGAPPGRSIIELK
ncbi:hypothetical protein [Paraburkholderia oxyphila]|uniref:hypothetical protein n=1 Tax=Paraburkholderia oxyphila TaxID=614212 RepID=UPI000480E092|nr:hypothetical protein [Paraburkholderia oxyphila]